MPSKSGLVNASGNWFYPVVEEIPVLVPMKRSLVNKIATQSAVDSGATICSGGRVRHADRVRGGSREAGRHCKQHGGGC